MVTSRLCGVRPMAVEKTLPARCLGCVVFAAEMAFRFWGLRTEQQQISPADGSLALVWWSARLSILTLKNSLHFLLSGVDGSCGFQWEHCCLDVVFNGQCSQLPTSKHQHMNQSHPQPSTVSEMAVYAMELESLMSMSFAVLQ